MRYTFLKITLLVISLISLLVYHPAIGQDSKPVYSGEYPLGISWSADSQLLVFKDGGTREYGVRLKDQSWLSYDTSDGEVIETNQWPLQLDRDLIAQQNLPDTKDGETFIFLSPNKRYAVHAGPRLENYFWATVITDLKTGKSSTVPGDYIIDPFRSPDYFNVLWNKDSNAFIVSTSLAGIQSKSTSRYVTYVDDDISTIETQQLHSLSINDTTYYITSTFSLSPDGKYILLNVSQESDATDAPQKTLLIIWNSVDPSSSTFIDDFDSHQIIGASFLPDDPINILIVDDESLSQYNIQTKIKKKLDISLPRSIENSSLPERALFSPDGKWLALLRESTGGIWKLYVINISYKIE